MIAPCHGVPALVIHNSEDVVPVEGARWLARRIPSARFVELPGKDHWPWVTDSDELVDEVEHFLTGERHEPVPKISAARMHAHTSGSRNTLRSSAGARELVTACRGARTPLLRAVDNEALHNAKPTSPDSPHLVSPTTKSANVP